MDIKKLIESPNIAKMLEEEEVRRIGMDCHRGWEDDKRSRLEWEDWYAKALKLALQVQERKNDPWANCSNVKFPLVTIGALNWHSMAYPALIPPNDIVKMMAYGQQTEEQVAKARRIQAHMNFQLIEEDSQWEEDQDKALISLPIVGTVFKKIYFDTTNMKNRSEMVLAKDLVVNYYAKSLDDASRTSHYLELYPNTVIERIRTGVYSDIDLRPIQRLQDAPNDARDMSQKMQAPMTDENDPIPFVEQHCWLDLDNDGYKEPYVVTFELSSSQVVRVVARYFESDISYTGKKISSIKATQSFVKYGFIPSPDGGFYDLGLGALLGPINESVNTAINQLFDAGTMHILGGGFLGRGVRIKGGQYQMAPYQWQRVDSSGDDLRKNIVPLPTKEPSTVVFQLLQYLVSYGERIAGATDTQMGENPGQNTPAETMRTMNENGRKVFTGIYKRVWRSMKTELQLLCDLNWKFFKYNKTSQELSRLQPPMIVEQDYLDARTIIRPFANPHYISDEKRIQTNQMVQQLASSAPHLFKMPKLIKRTLDLLNVPDIQEIFDEKGQPSPSIKMLELQLDQKRLEFDQHKEQNRHQIAVLKATVMRDLNEGKVDKIHADIIKIMAEIEQGGQEIEQGKMGHLIALMNTLVGAAKEHQDDMLQAVEMVLKHGEGNGQDVTRGLARVEDIAANPSGMGVLAGNTGRGKGSLGGGGLLPR